MKRLICAVAIAMTLVPSRAQLAKLANTTLKLPQSPPVFGYTVQQIFGRTFGSPVAIATPPGETNRVFVVDRKGHIYVVSNITSASPATSTFLDISSRVNYGYGEQGLLGLAFHPDYKNNGYFYVFYVTAATSSDRLSRFSVSGNNPNAADASSEVVLIDQPDDYVNHNAGDLHFGTDGYLYVSLGDEGGGGDSGNNSQRIDKDFFSGIIRIDVDKRPGNLAPNPHPASSSNYSVPADNPFVSATSFNGVTLPDKTKVRTEFWAVGLRNPWRFSFDSQTGQMWCADVGQDLYEEVDIITKGGNFGWNYREGLHAYRGTPPAGFKATDPVYEYPHGNGNVSVTGGFVYRGPKMSELQGAYIFSDYGGGSIWALRLDAQGKASVDKLATSRGISAFAPDPSNGDVLICNVDDGWVGRLTYSTTQTGTPIPPALSQTGAFSDLASLTPAAGIVPYTINLPFWSDGAQKTRWFSVSDANKSFVFDPTNTWQTPTGAVWIKHFEMQMTNGSPNSARRLETRFIVRNPTGVYGVTYRWTNATDAVLVPEEGLDEPLAINDGGTVRTQIWHYPSRAECSICHNSAAGFVLGFNTPQMNCEMTYTGVTTNQIAALANAGYLSGAPSSPHGLLALAKPSDTSVSEEFRVRSYLAANCSQCHRPGGPATANFDTRIGTPTDLANLINGTLNNNFGDPANKTLVPNSPGHSMILARMSIRGTNQMPPIASNIPDPAGTNLVRAFVVGELAARQTFADWELAKFGEPLPPEAAADADPDSDGASNLLEYLTGTNPKQAGDAWSIHVSANADSLNLTFENPANRGVVVEGSDSLSGPWTPIVDPGNQPLFPSATDARVLSDPIGDQMRFYRARLISP